MKMTFLNLKLNIFARQKACCLLTILLTKEHSVVTRNLIESEVSVYQVVSVLMIKGVNLNNVQNPTCFGSDLVGSIS